MIPEAGQRFGPYEILATLGGGGMGLVFRAWDERLHREVAVKLLHDSNAIPGMRERFLQEARAASALNHPNICTIFDIGDQDGDPYLVMELLEGETLKARIARGALPAEQIIRYAEKIADALTVAHAKGVVHRDIKPANIFLVAMPNGRSQAKVLDFGLAKIGLEVHGGWESRTLDLTLGAATVGTLAYMSPEQARGESLDARSDLFSLGVVMYEMATRRPPFQGATSAQIFEQLFDRDPEPLRHWNDSVPRELERVILKLLAKDRKVRFQTAKELREALAQIHMKTGRNWFRKAAESAVPLVRVNDPVAPRRIAKQKSDSSHQGVERESSPARVEAISKEPDPDRLSARAINRLQQGNPATERNTTDPLSNAGFKTDDPREQTNDSSGAMVHSGFATGAAATAGTQRQTGSGFALNAAQRINRGLPHSRSEATQAEYGFGGLQAERSDVEIAAQKFEERSQFTVNVGTKTPGPWFRPAVIVALAAVAVAGLVLLLRSGLLRPLVLRPNEKLLLTVIDNKTGDRTLDDTVMQGLEIALHQSNSLGVLGSDAYRAGMEMMRNGAAGAAVAGAGQSVAQKVGAKAYLYGEITGSEPPYTISVEVLKADTNDMAASLVEQAASREDIPAAIGRLGQALRAEISQDRKADIHRSVPFNQDATANIDALHAYTLGQAAMLNGRPEDALKAYQMAVTLDPNFVQAQIQLSWLYRAEKAELASSFAAQLAKIAAGKTSDKMKKLTQFCYEMNVLGDNGKALATIRAYAAKYPRDVNGMKALAQVLQAQGDLPGALIATQHGYGEDPFDMEAYNEAEDALLGLNQYDSVLQLEAQAKREGVTADADVLPAAYMSGRDDVVAEQVRRFAGVAAGSDTASAEPGYARIDSYARYLDSTGRAAAALQLWKSSAARAEKTPELSSSAASMLAQAALDRAITESCTIALAMVDELRAMPKGPAASFDTAMAAALCGDQTYAEKSIATLQQAFPQDTAVMQNWVSELRAAGEIGVNEPGKALQELVTVKDDGRAPFLQYLRGMASIALGQTTLAIDDFQNVLGRRGAAWSIAGTLYPMTDIDIARAYVVDKDKIDSMAAYRAFLTSWSDADRTQPLMKEAQARSK